LGRATYKVKDGKLIKVWVVEHHGRIEKIKITGDFFLHPETLIDEMEAALVNKPLNEGVIAGTIERLMKERDATLIGASPEDIAKCIMMAAEGK